MNDIILSPVPLEDLQTLIEASVARAMRNRYENQAPASKWMNLDELCQYHPDKPARATIYKWTCERSIPFHKDGKKLRFLKSEIDEWLMKSCKKTIDDISDEKLAKRRR
jgi:excisionase family DNA binding protein